MIELRWWSGWKGGPPMGLRAGGRQDRSTGVSKNSSGMLGIPELDRRGPAVRSLWPRRAATRRCDTGERRSQAVKEQNERQLQKQLPFVLVETTELESVTSRV